VTLDIKCDRLALCRCCDCTVFFAHAAEADLFRDSELPVRNLWCYCVGLKRAKRIGWPVLGGRFLLTLMEMP